MKCNTCSTENVEGARFCANCGATLGTAEPAKNSLLGQVVGGRYNVKRVLGEGGMGIVYEAEQQMGTAVRKVALKTLHAHLSHDPSVSQRFHREVGTIASLEHPNTIKVYDFGATADGTLYIAMEFVAGKPLAKLIEETPQVPPDRVLKIMRQITGSLQEAHDQGIIHRDLKPDNVILTNRAGETDVVKLLDFGIAARTESADAQKEQKLTQQGMVLGTPPYMSPEQFTGKALDSRSDVYSLGVMAYEMVTGRLPFDATTPWQWATEHMTAKPLPFEATPVSSQIPASMRDAILRSLAKNREERQSSAKQFYEELAGQSAPAAASASSGTAAMAAAPNFGPAPSSGGGPAKTAAMATPAGGSAAQAPVAPAIAAPIPAPRGGSGKGLIVGLASVGAVLLVGIIIVAARAMKPAQTDTPPTPVATPSTPATIAPIDTPEPVTPPPTGQAAATETAAPTAAEEPPRPTHTGTATGTGSKTQPAASGSAAPAGGGGGCAGCISAAKAGNYGAAAAAYKSCNDAAQKTECTGFLRSKAPGAARTAAFNNECAKAKSIVAAGQSMGIASPDFQTALSTCKGK
jgi:eukaryotic-like serine/threonine-protein kinase